MVLLLLFLMILYIVFGCVYTYYIISNPQNKIERSPATILVGIHFSIFGEALTVPEAPMGPGAASNGYHCTLGLIVIIPIMNRCHVFKNTVAIDVLAVRCRKNCKHYFDYSLSIQRLLLPLFFLLLSSWNGCEKHQNDGRKTHHRVKHEKSPWKNVEQTLINLINGLVKNRVPFSQQKPQGLGAGLSASRFDRHRIAALQQGTHAAASASTQGSRNSWRKESIHDHFHEEIWGNDDILWCSSWFLEDANCFETTGWYIFDSMSQIMMKTITALLIVSVVW